MRVFAVFAIVFIPTFALAQQPGREQAINKPVFAPGDSWTYTITVRKGVVSHQMRQQLTVNRADSSEILVAVKDAGSDMPPAEQLVGADWSRVRNVDGKQTVVNRPLDFPLTVGKHWTIDYTDDHPRDRAHSSEHFHEVYAVTGWASVTVPAGSFKALLVEANGEWTAELAPRAAIASRANQDAEGSTMVMQSGRVTRQTVSGRLYKAFWYVPSVKRFVKTDEEYFGSNGVLGERLADELEGYKIQ
jgi:hypothetical protein